MPDGATGDAYNRAGRIATVSHAAGVEARYYGKLGETVKENFCRKSSRCSKPADADKPGAQPDSSAIATALHSGTEDLHDIEHDNEHDNEHAPLYVTQYVYDTFGRLQRLTYPDGEVLTYGYDAGGLVNKATGVKGKHSYAYLKRLDYDKFDQRVYLKLGNGITTSYAYRADNRRLDKLQAQLPNATHYRFQNLAYGYDNVGNILGLSNNSVYPQGQQGIGEEVGGPVSQSYVYDDLYRLKEANGEYRHNATDLRRYRMSMDYDSIHNIVAKEQLDEETEVEDGKTEHEVEHETSSPGATTTPPRKRAATQAASTRTPRARSATTPTSTTTTATSSSAATATTTIPARSSGTKTTAWPACTSSSTNTRARSSPRSRSTAPAPRRSSTTTTATSRTAHTPPKCASCTTTGASACSRNRTTTSASTSTRTTPRRATTPSSTS